MAALSSTSSLFFPSRLTVPNLSSQSNLYPLRIFQFQTTPCSSFSQSSTISISHNSVTARYGGAGNFPRPSSGDSRRNRKGGSDDDDQALNISSIRSDTVRLIDEKQNMIGIVSKNEALQRAEDAELDLVILSPDADPPVLRLMDYNKFKYEQQKKKRDQQKKSAAHRMDLKELKMGYNIDVHDYSVRLKAALKFLKAGDKVKVVVQLKGRESDFRNKAIELIRRFQSDIGELAVEESKSFRERSMTLVMVPNKVVTVQKPPESPKKNETSANEVSAAV
ncbi:translation initiation factor IF3-2, chloroplastic-like [Apium graveolens]|uniref:translation initiation factor IF3-2, chloroplastic-like n=1 Tax=Apium graveolens TaxID=4045 RepID=UPI003D7A2957